MEPTPTGDPWTLERVSKIMAEEGYHGIVAAHNAALAAACKAQADETKRCIEMVGGLATERDKHKAEMGQCLNLHVEDTRNDAETIRQLAAERERYRDVANALGLYPVPSHEKLIAGIQQLREQLRITTGDLRHYVDARDELARKLAVERERAHQAYRTLEDWKSASMGATGLLQNQLEAAVDALELVEAANTPHQLLPASILRKVDAALAQAGKGKV